MAKSDQFQAFSISISGLLSWQIHALNNEGNEGNQSLTRRYYIIDKNDPEPQYVNGISGDMLKHIQAEHLHRVAIENNLSLSDGGRRFDPDRIGYDLTKNTTYFNDKEGDLSTRTKKVLQVCSMSDLEGFMVTVKGGQTLKRESVIEFGAIVGIPGSVKTQSYFHAKYGADNPTPYNVQVSSGLYATVLNIEAFRIGYNPHSFDYAINTAERKKRLDALIKSVLYTYLQPNGAKRNTHLPHPDHFEGVITVSTKRCPAPMISPLQIESYQRQISGLTKTLNNINGEGTILEYPFNDFAEFAEQIEKLIQQSQPWETTNGEGNE
jgi:CRISPR-associated protein Cst2